MRYLAIIGAFLIASAQSAFAEEQIISCDLKDIDPLNGPLKVVVILNDQTNTVRYPAHPLADGERDTITLLMYNKDLVSYKRESWNPKGSSTEEIIIDRINANATDHMRFFQPDGKQYCDKYTRGTCN